MLSYVVGELAEIYDGLIVVDNNGIGFNIMTPATVISQLPQPGTTVKIYTYLHVKEDAMNVYGFLNRDDLEVFKQLLNVSGIGPKGALSILSTISADELRFAVLSGDVAVIKGCPGIGAKTAQKVIIELKDRIKLEDAFESALSKKNESNNSGNNNILMVKNDAIEALISLGYSNKDAYEAVKKVDAADSASSEDILKAALRYLG